MACKPSHKLALLLWKQEIRELKLAATWIDQPQWVTREQMEAWSQDFTNTEIVEQVVMNLFARATGTEKGRNLAQDMAIEWINDKRTLVIYAGLLLAARSIRSSQVVEYAIKLSDGQTATPLTATPLVTEILDTLPDTTSVPNKKTVLTLLNAIHTLILSGRLTSTTAKGSITALRHLANHSAVGRDEVLLRINEYACNADRQAAYVASELAWQVGEE